MTIPEAQALLYKHNALEAVLAAYRLGSARALREFEPFYVRHDHHYSGVEIREMLDVAARAAEGKS